MLKAYIGSIQSFNVHDGNGFRTTVFFQGCNLRCKWCQNPELISHKPVLLYNESVCIGCRECKKAGTIEEMESVCYPGAKRMSSKLMTVEEVVNRCEKDGFFYQFHKGGVTVSGGEPLLHVDFLEELFLRLLERKINITVETAGFVGFDCFEKVMPYVDTFLYDLKILTKELRKKWLGSGSDLMLTNLRKLSKIHNKVIIRIPLIPDVNDTKEEFTKILDFTRSLDKIRYMHILPFHQMGSQKYKMAGLQYEMDYVHSNAGDRIEWCISEAKRQGYEVDLGGSGFFYQ